MTYFYLYNPKYYAVAIIQPAPGSKKKRSKKREVVNEIAVEAVEAAEKLDTRLADEKREVFSQSVNGLLSDYQKLLLALERFQMELMQEFLKEEARRLLAAQQEELMRQKLALALAILKMEEEEEEYAVMSLLFN